MSNGLDRSEILRIARQGHERVGCRVSRVKVSNDARLGLVSATRPAGTGCINRLPFILIHLCVSGRGEVVQETDAYRFGYEISPGTAGIAPIGEGQGAWPQCSFISLGIAPSLLSEAYKDMGSAPPSAEFVRRRASEPVRDLLVECIMRELECDRGDALDRSYVRPGITVLLQRIFSGDPQPAVPAIDSEQRIAPLSNRDLRRIEAFVMAGISRRITVEKLSELVGLSKYHFSRRFQASTGVSPYQFIINRKMEVAAERLAVRGRRLTVTEAALSVGYDDPANFARAFFKRWGMSPTEWQRRHLTERI